MDLAFSWKPSLQNPSYNVEMISFSKLPDWYQLFVKRQFHDLGASGGPNFLWFPFDLGSFYNAHQPFADSFREKHGVTLESVLAVIASLSAATLLNWTAESEVVWWRSWQRAYEGPWRIADVERQLEDSVPKAIAELALPFDSSKISLRDAISFLTLSDLYFP